MYGNEKKQLKLYDNIDDNRLKWLFTIGTADHMIKRNSRLMGWEVMKINLFWIIYVKRKFIYEQVSFV